ncbi:MAG TPA: hypothetical protein VMU83_16280 [Hanamia sp.]|nr:hypothetical protein [Hanamia sp.]
MKIAATVILYYPNEIVIRNIQSYINSVERLYIVDNTEIPVAQITERLIEFPNSIYLHDGENKGIAARLNQASHLATKEGYDWLLTMDQDSSFQEKILINYLNCFHSFAGKEKVSMFGISYFEKMTNLQICNSIKVNELITSGSLLNLQLVPVIGEFDEKLFIDEVDFEYCLKSVLNGFGIFRFTNIFLTHNLGETSYHRSFKTFKLTSRVLHSPERIYYMTRNILYVQSIYGKATFNEIKIRKMKLLNRYKNNLLYNKKRFQVIKYIAKGYWDYKKNRMGKLK